MSLIREISFYDRQIKYHVRLLPEAVRQLRKLVRQLKIRRIVRLKGVYIAFGQNIPSFSEIELFHS